jgi:hypothetical protein
MRSDLFKGAVLGSIVSTVVLLAASALAGTGVGAVFNLGTTNRVNATSTLKGATGGKSLQITNTGSGRGLGITVGSGKAPIVVNSSAGNATNLDADKLDGIDSSGFQQTGAEAWHEVGSGGGEPAFQNGYSNCGGNWETVAFYRDNAGIVHLKGCAIGSGSAAIFQLPVGYRPAPNKEIDIAAGCTCTVIDAPTGDEVDVKTGKLQIFGAVGTALDGAIKMSGTSSAVWLDGVSFREVG